MNVYTLVVFSHQADFAIELGIDDFFLDCNESYLIDLMVLSRQFVLTWQFNQKNIQKNQSKISVKQSGFYLCELKEFDTKRKWFTNLTRVKVKYQLHRFLRDLFLRNKILIMTVCIMVNVVSIMTTRFVEQTDLKYTKLSKAFIKDFNLKAS